MNFLPVVLRLAQVFHSSNESFSVVTESREETGTFPLIAAYRVNGFILPLIRKRCRVIEEELASGLRNFDKLLNAGFQRMHELALIDGKMAG